MGNREIFATRLKEIRTQTGKSQKEFATMVQSTAATISAYENATKNPSLDIVMNIAEKCNVSIDWLCGLSNQKELKPEINNFKDFAIRILELLEIDTFYSIYFEEIKSGNARLQALVLPENPEFINFVETYKELCTLFNNKKIKEYVLDTWLNGALEDLEKIRLRYTHQEMLDITDDLYNAVMGEDPEE